MTGGDTAIGIVNVPDVSPSDDDFTHLSLRRRVEWTRLTGLPSNSIERGVRVVHLARYRAALQAARAARSGRVVVSHLPLMTAATSLAMTVLRRRTPHLAFSFNFTNLPTDRRLHYLRSALNTVDRFAVFSEFERSFYSNYFDIDVARFVPVLWTQSVPSVDLDPGIDTTRPYLCAIGGEGRDFALLMDAARKCGVAMRVVVIARPHSLAGVTTPDNVEVLINIPQGRTWAIAKASLGVLVPLLSSDTCCGQITIVSAKQLGLPIVVTRSFATEAYVGGRSSILECQPDDADEFALLMQRLVDERTEMRRIAEIAREAEIGIHDRSKWAAYVDDFLDDMIRSGGLPEPLLDTASRGTD